MKNTSKGFILLPLLMASLFLSCRKNEPNPNFELCRGVYCYFGTCVMGVCECYEGYEGEDCLEEKTPAKIYLQTVKVTKFPGTRSDGTPWDIGSAADLRVEFHDVDGNVLYQSSVQMDAESAKSYSFAVNSEVEILAVEEIHSFVLIDQDDGSPDELIDIVPVKPFVRGRSPMFFPERNLTNHAGTSTIVCTFKNIY